jgi:hypothetical protein
MAFLTIAIAAAAWGFIAIQFLTHGYKRLWELLAHPEGSFEEFASVVMWLLYLTALIGTGYATGYL